MHTKGKDKAKKQKTRPTEMTAIGNVLMQAREEGVSLRTLISSRRNRPRQYTTFESVIRANVEKYLNCPPVPRPPMVADQILYAVNWGSIGDEVDEEEDEL